MRVKLVYGCPCSGKTTYIRNHKPRDAPVYDVDSVTMSLLDTTNHAANPGSAKWIAVGMRQSAIENAEKEGVEELWLSCSWITDEIESLVASYDTEMIPIEATKEECLNHLENDETRLDKDAWREVIEVWFRKHETSSNHKKIQRKDDSHMKDSRRFWNWKEPEETDTSQERVLELYGTIAEQPWLDDDVTPKMFHDELFAGSGPVTIWLSSPGGDCVAASQIYSMLMDYPQDVTVKIDGIAASAASVIAMAGTRVLMAPTGMLLIHNPMTMAYGNQADMEKAIDMLDEVKESIINAYEIKTGLSRAKISHLMDEETWMNANKAIELGFADDILTDEKKQPANVAYSFSGRKAETALLNKLTEKCGKAEKGETVSDKKFVENLIRQAVEDIQLQAASPKENTPIGTPITELEKRLNLLK